MCPYRWFVDHELKPQRIDPRRRRLTAGQIAHKVLERLYAEQPGEERRPTPATLRGVEERARRSWSRRSAPRSSPASAPTRPRPCTASRAWCSPSSPTRPRRGSPFLPDPELAEASFGFEDSEKPPLEARERRHPRADRPDRHRPGRRGAGPGLQVRRQGRGRQGDAREGASSSSSSTCSRPGSSGAGSRRWPLPAARRRTSARKPKGLLRKSLRRTWPASTRGRTTTSTTRLRAGPRRRPRSRRRRSSRRSRRATSAGGRSATRAPPTATSSRSAAASVASPRRSPPRTTRSDEE